MTIDLRDGRRLGVDDLLTLKDEAAFDELLELLDIINRRRRQPDSQTDGSYKPNLG